jgi:small nuclear ribonucleoprotein (snRNP)-like protein
VVGKLKGFDTLVNLVLDECEEYIRGKQREASFKYFASLNIGVNLTVSIT